MTDPVARAGEGATPSPVRSSHKPGSRRLTVDRVSFFLVFLVLFHLWLNHIQTEVGTLSYDLVVGRFTKWPLLRVVDFLILALGLGHGVNGLKHLIDDHVHEPGKRAFWLSLLLVAFLAFLAAGTAVLFVLPVEGM